MRTGWQEPDPSDSKWDGLWIAGTVILILIIIRLWVQFT